MLAEGDTTMTLMRYNTFNPWRDFDRLFGVPHEARAWKPAIDIAETDESYILTGDLPGLSQKDIEVRVEDGTLTIRGERKAEGNGDQSCICHLERRHGKFRRTFRLPNDVNEDKVGASYEHGVLVVTLPKQEPAETARIITIH